MSQSFPITIVMQNDSNQIASFYIEHDQRIGEIKSVLEAQWEVPAASLILSFNGLKLKDTDRLNEIGFTQNDLLQAEVVQRLSASQSGETMARAQARTAFEHIRSNAQLQNELRQANPNLLQAALSDSADVFENLFIQQQRVILQQRMQEAQRLAALEADPLNEENQLLIEQEIRKANIERNLNAAIEHNPEAFHRVCMLYVNLRLANKKLVAFVDSGAQSTIMSLDCAERLGILHLLDRRFTGIARGAGTSTIVGRIHYVEIQLGSHYIAVSLSVLDSVHIDFLLGLDMLKKHQMCIDLKKNCLRIDDDEIPFLQEHELPESVTKFEEEHKSPAVTPSASRTAGPNLSPAPFSTQTSTANNASSLSNVVNEQDIVTLMGLGFTREQAASALQSCNGNVEFAAGMLFH